MAEKGASGRGRVGLWPSEAVVEVTELLEELELTLDELLELDVEVSRR